MPFTGTQGTVTVGSTDMDVSGWKLDIDAETYDGTNTSDNGWTATYAGPKSVKGSFDFFYDVNKRPTGVAQGLTPGNAVNLTLLATTGEIFSGVGLITKLSIDSKVKGLVSVTCSFENQGAWSFPS